MCMFVYVCVEGSFPWGSRLCRLSFRFTDRLQCLFNVCVGSGDPHFGSRAVQEALYPLTHLPIPCIALVRLRAKSSPPSLTFKVKKCLIRFDLETSWSFQIYKDFQGVLKESLNK